jgi:hypothetical protein
MIINEMLSSYSYLNTSFFFCWFQELATSQCNPSSSCFSKEMLFETLFCLDYWTNFYFLEKNIFSELFLADMTAYSQRLTELPTLATNIPNSKIIIEKTEKITHDFHSACLSLITTIFSSVEYSLIKTEMQKSLANIAPAVNKSSLLISLCELMLTCLILIEKKEIFYHQIFVGTIVFRLGEKFPFISKKITDYFTKNRASAIGLLNTLKKIKFQEETQKHLDTPTPYQPSLSVIDRVAAFISPTRSRSQSAPTITNFQTAQTMIAPVNTFVPITVTPQTTPPPPGTAHRISTLSPVLTPRPQTQFPFVSPAGAHRPLSTRFANYSPSNSTITEER